MRSVEWRACLAGGSTKAHVQILITFRYLGTITQVHTLVGADPWIRTDIG